MESSANARPLPPPPVIWAQRKDKILLTIQLENVSNPIVTLKDSSLYFRGQGGTGNKDHEVLMEFNKEINPDTSKYHVTGREVIFTIMKKEDNEGYWPRLLKDSKKVCYLKTDFDQWRDEDGSDVDDHNDSYPDEMIDSAEGAQGDSSTSNLTVDVTEDTSDNTTDDTTIYVGNLPYKMTWQKLKAFFNKFGRVIYAQIINDYITRKPKGYGFVQFSACDSAYRAIIALPEELNCLGRTLRVHMAHQNPRRRTVKKKVLQPEATVQSEGINEEVSDVDPASSINRLNDDSLIHIFGYLTLFERIGVERVCKRWQRCALSATKEQKHMKILKKFKKFCAFTDFLFYKIMYRSSCYLVSLDISRVSSRLDNKALEVIAHFCNNIEKLNMSGVRANNRGMEKFTKRCRNIRWLNIVGCWSISESGFWCLFKNCKKIEHLDCSGNPGFTGKCLIRANSSFKSLHASNCKKLCNEGLMYLTKRCPLMESLKLNRCDQLTNQAISTVTRSLPCLNEISVGDLPCQCGRDEPPEHIVQHFATPGIILKLELYSCSLTDVDLLLICNSCPLISELDISLSRLTDASVTQISALKHLEYLSACELYNITDASLMDVAKLGKLRRLRVQGCKLLTDQLMIAVAKNCLQIEEVDVAGIPSISANTLMAFHQSSLKRVGDSQLLIFTAFNDFDEDVVLDIPRSPAITIIESYRPLYPVKLRWISEIEDEELIARIHNPMFLNEGLGGWRMAEVRGLPADLVDFDEIFDEDFDEDFEDLEDDEYLVNDDPLEAEWWMES